MKAILNKIASSWPFIIGLIIYAVLSYAYFKHFGKYPVSIKNEHWGQLGDFIGGLANPLFTLLTVLLFVKSLEQNKKAIEISTQELILTRNEIVHNKSLQTMTKDALDKQINIAQSESDLNNARSFIINYRVIISELDKKYRTESVGFMTEEKERLCANITSEINMYKHKIEELDSLINHLYDDLVERLNLRAGAPDINNLFYEGYKATVKCMIDHRTVLSYITAPDGTESIMPFLINKNENENLNTWRYNAKLYGIDESKKVIDFHAKTGFWYESDYKLHLSENKEN